MLALFTHCGYFLQSFLWGSHICETRWLRSTNLWWWSVLIWPLNHQMTEIVTRWILWLGYQTRSNLFENSQSFPILKGRNVFFHDYLIELVNIVKLMNFFKRSFLVHKLTSNSIWAWDLHLIVKLSAILGLILKVKGCSRHVHLVIPMSKLTLVAIATELPIRLNPILAHLRLVFSPITLLGTVLIRLVLVSLLLSASSSCLSLLLALFTSAWVLHFNKFSLLYQSRWV